MDAEHIDATGDDELGQQMTALVEEKRNAVSRLTEKLLTREIKPEDLTNALSLIAAQLNLSGHERFAKNADKAMYRGKGAALMLDIGLGIGGAILTGGVGAAAIAAAGAVLSTTQLAESVDRVADSAAEYDRSKAPIDREAATDELIMAAAGIGISAALAGLSFLSSRAADPFRRKALKKAGFSDEEIERFGSTSWQRTADELDDSPPESSEPSSSSRSDGAKWEERANGLRDSPEQGPRGAPARPDTELLAPTRVRGIRERLHGSVVRELDSLPEAKRDAFYKLGDEFHTEFAMNTPERQAELIGELDWMLKAAAYDGDFASATKASSLSHGHAFEFHGPHPSDASIGSRAHRSNKAGPSDVNHDRSRWDSYQTMVETVEYSESQLFRLDGPPDHCAFKSKIVKQIQQGKTTVEEIVAAPLDKRLKALKKKVEVRVDDVGVRAGTISRPDGSTYGTKGARVIFELTPDGTYKLLTAYPSQS